MKIKDKILILRIDVVERDLLEFFFFVDQFGMGCRMESEMLVRIVKMFLSFSSFGYEGQLEVMRELVRWFFFFGEELLKFDQDVLVVFECVDVDFYWFLVVYRWKIVVLCYLFLDRQSWFSFVVKGKFKFWLLDFSGFYSYSLGRNGVVGSNFVRLGFGSFGCYSFVYGNQFCRMVCLVEFVVLQVQCWVFGWFFSF